MLAERETLLAFPLCALFAPLLSAEPLFIFETALFYLYIPFLLEAADFSMRTGYGDKNTLRLIWIIN